MAPVRILGISLSNLVQSVLLALAEKGVAWELVKPEVPLGDPSLRAFHPWGKIPVALLDEGPLGETTAILRWIDATRAGRALMPADPFAAARADQWLSSVLCYLDRHWIRDIAVPAMLASRRGEKREPGEVELATVDRDLAIFDAALGEHPFFGGDEPILPDLAMAPIVNYMALSAVGRPLLDRRPGLLRFLAAVHARPSSLGILRRPEGL